MGLTCFLCQCSSDKEKNISLHRFPIRQKLPVIFDHWLIACALKESDYMAGIRICSNHFQEQDKFLKNGVIQIKQGAIPSVNLPKVVVKEEKMDEELSTPQPLDEQNFNLVSEVQNFSQMSEEVLVRSLHNMDDVDKHVDYLYNCMMEKRPCTVISFKLRTEYAEKDIPPTNVPVPSTSSANIPSTSYDVTDVRRTPTLTDETELTKESPSELQTPPKRRKFYYPRFISEIQISDLSTPRQASIVLDFVKSTNEIKSAKIKKLQKSKLRIQKRVHKLEGLLSQYEKTRN